MRMTKVYCTAWFFFLAASVSLGMLCTERKHGRHQIWLGFCVLLCLILRLVVAYQGCWLQWHGPRFVDLYRFIYFLQGIKSLGCLLCLRWCTHVKNSRSNGDHYTRPLQQHISKTSRDIKDSHNHKGKMHDPKKIMLDLSKAHINEKQHLRLPLTTSRLRLKVPIKQASKVEWHVGIVIAGSNQKTRIKGF